MFCIQHVRRAAVSALSTAAHNKPNLIKGLLQELLPLLYEQTVVKVWNRTCVRSYSMIVYSSDLALITCAFLFLVAARIDKDS